MVGVEESMGLREENILDNNKIERGDGNAIANTEDYGITNTPPVGHSITGALTPLRPNGSTSPGGASPIKQSKYDRRQLKLDTQEITGRMTAWLLEGNRLEQMLQETKLRDVMISLGVATDKLLLLEGQPTAILGVAQQAKLDELLPALTKELERRKITLTERKVELSETGAANA